MVEKPERPVFDWSRAHGVRLAADDVFSYSPDVAEIEDAIRETIAMKEPTLDERVPNAGGGGPWCCFRFSRRCCALWKRRCS